MIKTGFKSSENPHCGQSEATKHFAGSHHHHIQDSSLFDMYQHGTPIVLNGKLLKNPNLASHYACMRRHLGVIYGQTSQSLPPHGYVVLNQKLIQIKAKGWPRP